MTEQTHCRCGALLEYEEEKFNGVCWCCAARRGRDIGAKYYYSVGIWRKYSKRKPKKGDKKNEEAINNVGNESIAPSA
jgi:hypothetical protein